MDDENGEKYSQPYPAQVPVKYPGSDGFQPYSLPHDLDDVVIDLDFGIFQHP